MLADSSFRKDEEQPSWHVRFVPLKAKQFSVGIKMAATEGEKNQRQPCPDCPEISFQALDAEQ